MSPTDWLTLVLVLITAFYAWVTFQILKANEGVLSFMKQQTEELTRPYVHLVLYLVPATDIFALRIENSGRTAAANVRLTLDHDFHTFGDMQPERNMKSFNVFSQPITNFGPGARIDLWLAQGSHLFGEEAGSKFTPLTFAINATYEFGGKSVTEMTTIDFHPYLTTDTPQVPLSKELKDIKRAIEDLTRKIEKF